MKRKRVAHLELRGHAPEPRGDAEQEAVVRCQRTGCCYWEVGLGGCVHELEDILRECLGGLWSIFLKLIVRGRRALEGVKEIDLTGIWLHCRLWPRFLP